MLRMRPSGRPASFTPTFFFESLCCWRGSAFMASGLKVRDADCQPQMNKSSEHSGCSRTSAAGGPCFSAHSPMGGGRSS